MEVWVRVVVVLVQAANWSGWVEQGEHNLVGVFFTGQNPTSLDSKHCCKEVVCSEELFDFFGLAYSAVAEIYYKKWCTSRYYRRKEMFESGQSHETGKNTIAH